MSSLWHKAIIGFPLWCLAPILGQGVPLFRSATEFVAVDVQALPEGGTELNTTLRATIRYLKENSRPRTRRAIVVITDNIARKTTSDRIVLNDLWETDTVANAVLFRPMFVFPGANADVRKFVLATGGEIVKPVHQAGLPQLFERMRKRYVLFYTPPDGPGGEAHKIRVDLSAPAKAKLKDRTIRARTGYIDMRSKTPGL